MNELVKLIESNEAFLIKRTLEYAKRHNYTKYTSTLEEAWRVSINGLSQALLTTLKFDDGIPELNVDADYSSDRIGAFGILEAQHHRNRGVTLEMFLGMMKYYRESYLDLVKELHGDKDIDSNKELLFINRFFDRVELAFCSEWTGASKEALILNLQESNRTITNEKNKYLTIFESIPMPAIILDNNNMIDNMNKSAMEFFKETSMGTSYYSGNKNAKALDLAVPWIVEEFNSFSNGFEIEATIEKNIELATETMHMVIKFHRLLDVSEKFKGTIIIFSDLTYKKQIYKLNLRSGELSR